MDHAYSFAFLFIGLALGGGAAWLILRGKVQHAFDRGKAEGDGQRIALGERIAAREQTIEGLNAQVRQLQEKDRPAAGGRSEIASQTRATRHNPQPGANTGRGKVGPSRPRAGKTSPDAFKALAGEALKSSNTSFLELAKTQLEKFQESAKGDLEKRQTAIEEIGQAGEGIAGQGGRQAARD